MLRTMLLVGVFAAAPMVAAAEPAELTDANYARAARCLTLAALPELEADAFDVGALRAAYDAAGGRRSQVAISQARSAERAARLVGRRSSDAAYLRLQRDQACDSFESQGLASAPAEAPTG